MVDKHGRLIADDGRAQSHCRGGTGLKAGLTVLEGDCASGPCCTAAVKGFPAL